MSDRNDRYRLSQLLFAGLLSAAFHAGFAPAAGSQPPPPAPAFAWLDVADGDVEEAEALTIYQHLAVDAAVIATNVKDDECETLLTASVLAETSLPSSCGVLVARAVGGLVLCAASYGVPAWRLLRLARAIRGALRSGKWSDVVGSFFCADAYLAGWEAVECLT